MGGKTGFQGRDEFKEGRLKKRASVAFGAEENVYKCILDVEVFTHDTV